MSEDTEFYIYLSSMDSLQYFERNKPDKFIVFLLREYELNGNWSCGLSEIVYRPTFLRPTRPKYLCVCVDICEDSFVSDNKAQILRKMCVLEDTERIAIYFTNPIYCKVIKRTFESIFVTVFDEQLQLSTLEEEISLTLHFKKNI